MNIILLNDTFEGLLGCETELCSTNFSDPLAMLHNWICLERNWALTPGHISGSGLYILVSLLRRSD